MGGGAHGLHRDRVVDQVLGQPGREDVSGTGVGSVQTPFSWLFGFVMIERPAIPAQLVVPAGTFRQYCVCTPA